MKAIFSVKVFWVFLLMFVFADNASAQDQIARCSNKDMQTTCPATCAALSCGDETFLEGNVSFCVTNFFGEEKRAEAADDSDCDLILGEEAVVPAVTEPEVEAQSGGEDCTLLNDIFEQEECELAKLAPECSRTVVELEGRSSLLVTDIKRELSTYGDLLTTDYGDVQNREALCNLTREELSESYQLASENPAVLRSLQRQAQDVQACQSDWEAVVRGYENAGLADSILDTLMRESEAELEELKGETESLSMSVQTLKNAVGTIRGVVKLHVNFCEG